MQPLSIRAMIPAEQNRFTRRYSIPASLVEALSKGRPNKAMQELIRAGIRIDEL